METSEISRTIEGLLPAIQSQGEAIERARQLPRALVDELRRSGVFSLTIPRAIGGLEAAPIEILRTIEAVSRADGSTGWCVMVAAGNNVAAGYMPEAGAREVFADPMAPSAGIAAPSGKAVRSDGGVRVSGRWSFASGIMHSDWVWAGCLVMENDHPVMTSMGPEILHVCMPVADVTIHDTWHVSGLCGTGSNDFTAEDVFVPAHRTFYLLDPAGHRSEPLYQMPPLHLFTFQLVSVSLGIARRALDELIALAQGKKPTLYNDYLADKASVHIELARAEAALGSARAFLYETVSDMWETVRSGSAPSPRQLAMGRAAATNTVETAASVTRTANVLGGGSSIYSSSTLQRQARDAEAITHHFTVAPYTWEETGRVLMGRQPLTPVF